MEIKENIFIKEEKYQKIKSLLKKKTDYFNEEELDILYQKVEV